MKFLNIQPHYKLRNIGIKNPYNKIPKGNPTKKKKKKIEAKIKIGAFP